MIYSEIFTPEEWSQVKSVMNEIHHNIPEHHMGKVWNWFQRIGKHNNPQPCSCQSSARYWIEAVNTIKNFITTQQP